jgi:hypothetical protein
VTAGRVSGCTLIAEERGGFLFAEVGRRSGIRKPLCATLAGLSLATVALPALAGDAFPVSNAILFSPSDPNAVVVRTNYGVLPSSDNGAHWQFLCLEALGQRSQDGSPAPALGISASGALIAGTWLGLSVSADTGCTWSCQGGPLAGASIVDLAVRPDSPSHVVALATRDLPSDGGADDLDTQVFETSDNGGGWAAVGAPLPAEVVPAAIAIARSDPSRIYVTATRGYGPGRTAVPQGGSFSLPDAGRFQDYNDHPRISLVEPKKSTRSQSADFCRTAT